MIHPLVILRDRLPPSPHLSFVPFRDQNIQGWALGKTVIPSATSRIARIASRGVSQRISAALSHPRLRRSLRRPPSRRSVPKRGFSPSTAPNRATAACLEASPVVAVEPPRPPARFDRSNYLLSGSISCLQIFADNLGGFVWSVGDGSRRAKLLDCSSPAPPE